MTNFNNFDRVTNKFWDKTPLLQEFVLPMEEFESHYTRNSEEEYCDWLRNMVLAGHPAAFGSTPSDTGAFVAILDVFTDIYTSSVKIPITRNGFCI